MRAESPSIEPEVNGSTEAALRERVKELTCLYGIAQIAERPGASLDEILQGIVELLPPAWQYPEATSARIVLDGRSCTGPAFRDGKEKQSATITVNGDRRGFVEVSYTEPKPHLDEGPFLREERHLIDAIARQVALIIERKQADEDRWELREQLMHADRLATIGQLAAGVAHELNEPLTNILGFAQLAGKSPELPAQAQRDISRIVDLALHAREVTKKLLLFARQTPFKKGRVNLNDIVEDGLYFFEARCEKAGIELVRSLAADLPEIVADPAQLNQALVNLTTNAVQAMPQGGRLTIQTRASEDDVFLVVEDTGAGMSEDTAKQIFVPFFTTKDVGEGTGLGLSVVHGIVTLHGGAISVESALGQGSRFEIRLPVHVASCEREGS
jgi:two-component system NtrC family sensor kinase